MKSHRKIVSGKLNFVKKRTALDQLKKYEEYIHTTKREVKILGYKFLALIILSFFFMGFPVFHSRWNKDYYFLKSPPKKRKKREPEGLFFRAQETTGEGHGYYYFIQGQLETK